MAATVFNLAMAATVLELQPAPAGSDPWDPDVLAACIAPASPGLPPGGNEDTEKAALRKQRGWRDPRGLMAYSFDSEYKDLYVYFDAADRTSPVNVAATKAFKCYGLDGKQHLMDWTEIRGPCLVVRQQPPRMLDRTGKLEQHQAPFKPLIGADELLATLLFFKKRDARHIALERDVQRMKQGMPPIPSGAPAERPCTSGWPACAT